MKEKRTHKSWWFTISFYQLQLFVRCDSKIKMPKVECRIDSKHAVMLWVGTKGIQIGDLIIFSHYYAWFWRQFYFTNKLILLQSLTVDNQVIQRILFFLMLGYVVSLPSVSGQRSSTLRRNFSAILFWDLLDSFLCWYAFQCLFQCLERTFARTQVRVSGVWISMWLHFNFCWTRWNILHEGKRKTLSFVIYIIINSNGSHYHTVSKSTDHVQFTRALFFQGAYNAE